MYKKTMCCLLVVALVLASGGVRIILPVTAVPMEEGPMENLGTVTTMPDFADDSVMVVLTHEASLEFIDYTPADFPEIECAEIEDLSSGKGAKVQAVLRGEELETDSVGARFMNQNINVDGFRRILYLKLANPSKGNVLRAVAALEQREDVYAAEPNYIFQVDLPVETQAVVSLDDTSIYGWAAEKIEQEAAWEIETGSSSVLVGILDCGIDATHPELSGKVSTTLSRDFITDDAYTATQDSTGHGTHIAGIIAAGHNSDVLNFSGVCQNVTLVSLTVIKRVDKTYGYDTETNYYSLVNAINYAEQQDIALLNLSLNVSPTDDGTGSGYNTMLHTAVNNYSGLMFCAAGNEYLELGHTEYPIPGCWDYDHIITVGASTQSDTKWENSNYHETIVDLFAPGESILSCYPRSMCTYFNCTADHVQYGYHSMSGTSMATPFVVGVAALILALHPNATRETVKATIVNTVDQLDALEGYCLSGGRLNAYNALMSKILHSNVTYTSVDWTYHQVSCDDCDTTWLEAHLERPGVEYCIYCQEFLG